MSKGRGQKIAIKFTDALTVANETPETMFEIVKGTYSVDGAYSGSSVELLKDGSTSTYWQSRSTSNYVYVALAGMKLKGFSVYKGSSYRPTTYTLDVSDDGVTYTNVSSGSFVAATGWEQVVLEEAIATNYIRVKFGYSSRLYLYEFCLLLMEYAYDGEEFKIEWQEPKHIGGPLVAKTGLFKRIARHPSDPDNMLLLETHDQQRFNNAEGPVSVVYDWSLGVLAGTGGAVESFSEEFLPKDLEPMPNPYAEEHINIGVAQDVDFVLIAYTFGYNEERIDVSAVANIEFVDTTIVNP